MSAPTPAGPNRTAPASSAWSSPPSTRTSTATPSPAQSAHEESQRRALAPSWTAGRCGRGSIDVALDGRPQARAGVGAGAGRREASGECRPLSTARSCSQSTSGWAMTASTDAVVQSATSTAPARLVPKRTSIDCGARSQPSRTMWSKSTLPILEVSVLV